MDGTSHQCRSSAQSVRGAGADRPPDHIVPISQRPQFETAPAQFEIPVNVSALPRNDPFSFDPSLSSTYRLLLLRAAGERPPPEGLTGMPVLFVHGHRGSFDQANQIVSQALAVHSMRVRAASDAAKPAGGSRQLGGPLDSAPGSHPHISAGSSSPGKSSGDDDGPSVPPVPPPLDVFAVDLREGSSAFHSGVLRAQAAFLNDCLRRICTLYGSTVEVPPGAGAPPGWAHTGPLERCVRAGGVVVVAHSMGGIVARLAMVMRNHPAGTVQSLVTLNSPHQAHPFTSDEAMAALYTRLNTVWSAAAVRGGSSRSRVAAAALPHPLDEDSTPPPPTGTPGLRGPSGAAGGDTGSGLLARGADWLRSVAAWVVYALDAAPATNTLRNAGSRGGADADIAVLSPAQWAAVSDAVVGSLTGGTTDVTIRPELSALTGLVAPTRAATGMSEGLAGSWLRTTHQDIAWCGQATAGIVRLVLAMQAPRWAPGPVFGMAGGAWEADPEARVASLRILLSPSVHGFGNAGGLGTSGGSNASLPAGPAPSPAAPLPPPSSAGGNDVGAADGEWRPLPLGTGFSAVWRAEHVDDAATLPKADTPAGCFVRTVPLQAIRAAAVASGACPAGSPAALASFAAPSAGTEDAALELITDLPRGPAAVHVTGRLALLERNASAPGADVLARATRAHLAEWTVPAAPYTPASAWQQMPNGLVRTHVHRHKPHGGSTLAGYWQSVAGARRAASGASNDRARAATSASSSGRSAADGAPWIAPVPLQSAIDALDYGPAPASLAGQPGRSEALSAFPGPIAAPREFRHFAEEGSALGEAGSLWALRLPWSQLVGATRLPAEASVCSGAGAASEPAAAVVVCVGATTPDAMEGGGDAGGPSAPALAAGEAAHDMDGWTVGEHPRAIVLAGKGWRAYGGGTPPGSDMRGLRSATAAVLPEAAAAASRASAVSAGSVLTGSVVGDDTAPSSDGGVARFAASVLATADATVTPRGWNLVPGRPALTRIPLPVGLTPAMEYGVTLTASCPAVGDPASGNTATGGPAFFPVVSYASSAGRRQQRHCVGCEARVLPWAAGSPDLDDGTVPPAVARAMWRSRSSPLEAAGLPPPRVTLHRLTTHMHGVIHWWGGGAPPPARVLPANATAGLPSAAADPPAAAAPATPVPAAAGSYDPADPSMSTTLTVGADAEGRLVTERLPAALLVLSDPSCTYRVALVPDLASFPLRWLRLRGVWLVTAFVTVIVLLLAAQTREWGVRRRQHRIALKSWLRGHRKAMSKLGAAARRAQVAHAAACEGHFESACRAGAAGGADAKGGAAKGDGAASAWGSAGGGDDDADSEGPSVMQRGASDASASAQGGRAPWARQRATTVGLLMQSPSDAEEAAATPTQMPVQSAHFVVPGLALPGAAAPAPPLGGSAQSSSADAAASLDALVASAVAAGAASLAARMPPSFTLPAHPARAHFPSLHHTATHACRWVCLLCVALSLVVSVWGGALVPPEPWLAIPARSSPGRALAASPTPAPAPPRRALAAPGPRVTLADAGDDDWLVGLPTEWLPPSVSELIALHVTAYAGVCCCCVLMSLLVDTVRVAMVATAALAALAADAADAAVDAAPQRLRRACHCPSRRRRASRAARSGPRVLPCRCLGLGGVDPTRAPGTAPAPPRAPAEPSRPSDVLASLPFFLTPEPPASLVAALARAADDEDEAAAPPTAVAVTAGRRRLLNVAARASASLEHSDSPSRQPGRLARRRSRMHLGAQDADGGSSPQQPLGLPALAGRGASAASPRVLTGEDARSPGGRAGSAAAAVSGRHTRGGSAPGAEAGSPAGHGGSPQTVSRSRSRARRAEEDEDGGGDAGAGAGTRTDDPGANGAQGAVAASALAAGARALAARRKRKVSEWDETALLAELDRLDAGEERGRVASMAVPLAGLVGFGTAAGGGGGAGGSGGRQAGAPPPRRSRSGRLGPARADAAPARALAAMDSVLGRRGWALPPAGVSAWLRRRGAVGSLAGAADNLERAGRDAATRQGGEGVLSAPRDASHDTGAAGGAGAGALRQAAWLREWAAAVDEAACGRPQGEEPPQLTHEEAASLVAAWYDEAGQHWVFAVCAQVSAAAHSDTGAGIVPPAPPPPPAVLLASAGVLAPPVSSGASVLASIRSVGSDHASSAGSRPADDTKTGFLSARMPPLTLRIPAITGQPAAPAGVMSPYSGHPVGAALLARPHSSLGGRALSPHLHPDAGVPWAAARDDEDGPEFEEVFADVIASVPGHGTTRGAALGGGGGGGGGGADRGIAPGVSVASLGERDEESEESAETPSAPVHVPAPRGTHDAAEADAAAGWVPGLAGGTGDADGAPAAAGRTPASSAGAASSHGAAWSSGSGRLGLLLSNDHGSGLASFAGTDRSSLTGGGGGSGGVFSSGGPAAARAGAAAPGGSRAAGGPGRASALRPAPRQLDPAPTLIPATPTSGGLARYFQRHGAAVARAAPAGHPSKAAAAAKEARARRSRRLARGKVGPGSAGAAGDGDAGSHDGASRPDGVGDTLSGAVLGGAGLLPAQGLSSGSHRWRRRGDTLLADVVADSARMGLSGSGGGGASGLDSSGAGSFGIPSLVRMPSPPGAGLLSSGGASSRGLGSGSALGASSGAHLLSSVLASRSGAGAQGRTTAPMEPVDASGSTTSSVDGDSADTEGAGAGADATWTAAQLAAGRAAEARRGAEAPRGRMHTDRSGSSEEEEEEEQEEEEEEGYGQDGEEEDDAVAPHRLDAPSHRRSSSERGTTVRLSVTGSAPSSPLPVAAGPPTAALPVPALAASAFGPRPSPGQALPAGPASPLAPPTGARHARTSSAPQRPEHRARRVAAAAVRTVDDTAGDGGVRDRHPLSIPSSPKPGRAPATPSAHPGQVVPQSRQSDVPGAPEAATRPAPAPHAAAPNPRGWVAAPRAALSAVAGASAAAAGFVARALDPAWTQTRRTRTGRTGPTARRRRQPAAADDAAPAAPRVSLACACGYAWHCCAATARAALGCLAASPRRWAAAVSTGCKPRTLAAAVTRFVTSRVSLSSVGWLVLLAWCLAQPWVALSAVELAVLIHVVIVGGAVSAGQVAEAASRTARSPAQCGRCCIVERIKAAARRRPASGSDSDEDGDGGGGGGGATGVWALATVGGRTAGARRRHAGWAGGDLTTPATGDDDTASVASAVVAAEDAPLVPGADNRSTEPRSSRGPSDRALVQAAAVDVDRLNLVRSQQTLLLVYGAVLGVKVMSVLFSFEAIPELRHPFHRDALIVAPMAVHLISARRGLPAPGPWSAALLTALALGCGLFVQRHVHRLTYAVGIFALVSVLSGLAQRAWLSLAAAGVHEQARETMTRRVRSQRRWG